MTNSIVQKTALLQEIDDEQAASLSGGFTFQSIGSFEFDTFRDRIRSRTRSSLRRLSRSETSALGNGSSASASLTGRGSVSVVSVVGNSRSSVQLTSE